VEFFEGTNSLCFGAFVATLCASPYCPYFALIWSNVPPGNYSLTARATDRAGASSVSDAAYITVFGGVNIYATDPNASEIHSGPNIDPASDPAVFTVRRFGETNSGIVVYYQVSGTASNGVDYLTLPGQVGIPAGASSADIVVWPIDDNLVEATETVVLTLLPTCPQCLFHNPMCEVAEGTNCYPIGPDSQAVAYIHDSDTGTNHVVVTIAATDAIAVEGPFCRSNWWWTSGWNGSNWTIVPATAYPGSTASWTNTCSTTNIATFVVRRSGPTNADLTVYYAIGGSASNGIDYLTLPSNITIPVGRHAARIDVIPIDDSIPEHIETVLLSLLPAPTATNQTPAYTIGIPSHAAAIILDNDQPRPPCMRLPDGMFHVCRAGTNGYSFCLLASPDLANWSVLCTNTITDGAIHYVDPDAVNFNTRFYRMLPEPSYSPQE